MIKIAWVFLALLNAATYFMTWCTGDIQEIFFFKAVAFYILYEFECLKERI